MYFIRIQLTDLLHPYVKDVRSTRTPITQKSQKMCTSAEIKPTLVTLSPPPNRYLSQQCKTTTNERNRTTIKKSSVKHPHLFTIKYHAHNLTSHNITSTISFLHLSRKLTHSTLYYSIFTIIL